MVAVQWYLSVSSIPDLTWQSIFISRACSGLASLEHCSLVRSSQVTKVWILLAEKERLGPPEGVAVQCQEPAVQQMMAKEGPTGDWGTPPAPGCPWEWRWGARLGQRNHQPESDLRPDSTVTISPDWLTVSAGTDVAHIWCLLIAFLIWSLLCWTKMKNVALHQIWTNLG